MGVMMSPEKKSFYRRQIREPGVIGGVAVEDLFYYIDQLEETIDQMKKQIAQQSQLISDRGQRDPVIMDRCGDIGDWYEMGGEG